MKSKMKKNFVISVATMCSVLTLCSCHSDVLNGYEQEEAAASSVLHVFTRSDDPEVAASVAETKPLPRPYALFAAPRVPQESSVSQQIAHVRVDADHRILDASRRAQDCNRHGQAIRDAEVQLAVADQRYDRAEKARLALLGEHQALGELVDRWAALNPTDRPDADTLIEALRKTHTKTSAAHARAWNTRTPTRKDTAT
jgi:hypothetical protein